MTEVARRLLDALAAPLLDPGARTWWPALLISLVVIAAVERRRDALPVAHPSSRLDLQLLAVRQLLPLAAGTAGLLSGWGLARGVVGALDGAFGAPALAAPGWLPWAYTAALWVASDLSRFALHLLMHRVPTLWAFHQVHHSAEVLTPLTFHRVHPVEAGLAALRGVLVSGLLGGVAFWLYRGAAVELQLVGVNAIGLVLSVTTGNLRHSEAFVRFPAPVERWLISPAQHQGHHSVDPRRHHRNLGSWLAVWDRLAGTWAPSGERPSAFGLPAALRNHDPRALSTALWGPVVAVAGARRGVGRPT